MGMGRGEEEVEVVVVEWGEVYGEALEGCELAVGVGVSAAAHTLF